MEEAQRFLRFVVPGLTLMIEFLGYLLISGDICFNQLMATSIGAAFSVLLATGGLGFLLGVFYYVIVWREYKLKIGADLHPVLQQAESNGWLKLTCCSKQRKASELSKRGAWRVVISYLNMRAETSKEIKGSLPRMDRLADIVNALGTTCLASLSALFCFVIYNLVYPLWWSVPWRLPWRAGPTFLLGFGMLYVHYRNYKGVIEDYENVFHSILLKEFEHEYNESKSSVAMELHVFENDLKDRIVKNQTAPPDE